jgi:phosphoribosylformylglycinamidine synthase
LCFADNNLGADFDVSGLNEKDSIKVLFAENSGIVFQADASVEAILSENKIEFFTIGTANNSGKVTIKNNEDNFSFDVSNMRNVWYNTSFLLDQKQTANGLAKARIENFAKQPLQYTFPSQFTGKLPKIDSSKPKPKAAILREKGSNSEREMANAMYLAGFNVKDVHMTDIISGRETLEDIQFLGAVGGFSNSDVLGSAKGWAGAIKYNKKANTVINNFFKRKDTLSVGICNGCQLFMELELINPEHTIHGKMLHNDSQKHESAFTSVKVQDNNSVMLSSLAGSTLGVWISHGEGKFNLPKTEENYNIVAKYGYDSYPSNPNGSDFNTAMLCDTTGRHLVMMPHIERSTFQWNWANYPQGRKDEVSPWLEAFVNAKNWVENK